MANILIAMATVAVIGGILGLLLSVFSKVFYVEEDPRLEKVIDLLPGINCGACGYPGCSGMAEAALNGEVQLSACKPGKQEMYEAIKEYLENTPGPDGNTVKVKI